MNDEEKKKFITLPPGCASLKIAIKIMIIDNNLNSSAMLFLPIFLAFQIAVSVTVCLWENAREINVECHAAKGKQTCNCF